MAKKDRSVDTPRKVSYNLPKGSLSKIQLGQSFAEYDITLKNPYSFVQTPAMAAALADNHAKCFYVGRRGTGKTATSLYLEAKFGKNAVTLLPQLFSSIQLPLDISEFRDTRQRPFKSLVTCFKRALLDEVLLLWLKNGLIKRERSIGSLSEDLSYAEDMEFDVRMLELTRDIFEAYRSKDQLRWLELVNRPKEMARLLDEFRSGKNFDFYLLIDRIDESWDGSDQSVILLMALMHACVELSNPAPFLRSMVFLRENIFERVRQIDNEFARLETWVVSVDWSRPLLLEFIERRLNIPFITKLPLGGPTWNYFFEQVEGDSSQDLVFNFCQERPRDVLTYCSLALESAQNLKHDRILIEDLQIARRRFSDSRLKDLGDEYQENYSQIQLVLSRFYGLGTKYTINGIAEF